MAGLQSKNPHLRKGNTTKRLKFAQRHKNWSAEQWKSVLWSDESKFEIFGTKRRQYVRRRNGEQFKDMSLQPTIKYGGGSVQVWGCISAGGVGDLFKIDDIMNAEKYRQILIHHAVPSGRRLVGPNFIFQHDNDPKHTAKKVNDYLQRKENQGQLQLMEWPPQSPDLNIIEAVWNYLDRKKQENQPTTSEELWDVLRDAWNNIPGDFLQKLQDSIPYRIDVVLKEKGSHTKY